MQNQTEMKVRRFGSLAVVFLCALGGPGRVLAQPKSLGAFDPLWRTAAAAATDTQRIAHPAYILVKAGDKVRATLKGDFPTDFVPPAGASLVLRHGPYLEVWANREALENLAARPETESLYPPLKFRPAVVTEARAAMGMAPFDAAGDAGAGVRVAVVDVGFSGWESLRGTELPSDTYYKSFLNSGTPDPGEVHGAAVAEIIHDIAPQAQLYLLQIAETADFVQAVDWCIDNHMNVVNMSLAFIAGPRDGTGYQAQQVDRAFAAGLIWVCAAGNEGATHWWGTWQDADADGVLDVAFGREVIGFSYVGQSGGFPLLLTQMVWNRWPSTSGLSFDLELYRDSLRTLPLSSSNGYPSLSEAYRLAVLDNPAVGRYYVSVVHRFGTLPAGLRFDVYLDNNFSHQVNPSDPAGSLVSPADAKGAVAVGAYDYGVLTPGASPVHVYSSQGPTWDGRIKPDLVAGSGVSTFTYGAKSFYGTSSSSPHVAGAAAVLSSATVKGGLFTYSWSAEDFLRLLRANSIDFGTAGPDNVYGLGGMVMPPASSDPAVFQVSSRPNPFNGRALLSFPAPPGTSYELRVFDLLGRLVWQTKGLHRGGKTAEVVWPGRGQHGEELASGVYFYRVDTDYDVGWGRAVLLK